MMDDKTILSKIERLNKEGLESTSSDPSSELCVKFLKDLDKEMLRIVANRSILLDGTLQTMEHSLNRACRSFKRYKRSELRTVTTISATTRSSTTKDQRTEWDDAIQLSNKLLNDLKTRKMGTTSEKKPQKSVLSSEPEPPKTVAEYRLRLVTHKKDLFKDPPVLPPDTPSKDFGIVVEKKKCPLPKRDKKTGLLSFVATASPGEQQQEQLQKLLKDFHPNRTPEEVLRAGAFGGTYFRPIVSAVTNISYNADDVLKDTLEEEWIAGLSKSQQLTSKTYRNNINKFGVKCGGSLGMWESSGWITSIDPYGWFQWYCRFYSGRRCSDDVRQISRWLKSAGPKGRFRSQLCNKILAAGTTHDDASISPVIRQTMLHWGLEITEDVLEKHRKRVGGKR